MPNEKKQQTGKKALAALSDLMGKMPADPVFDPHQEELTRLDERLRLWAELDVVRYMLHIKDVDRDRGSDPDFFDVVELSNLNGAIGDDDLIDAIGTILDNLNIPHGELELRDQDGLIDVLDGDGGTLIIFAREI